MALEHNVSNIRRELVPSGTWGNLIVNYNTVVAASANGEQTALLKIPANCVIVGAEMLTGALGAGTAIALKVVKQSDGSDIATLLTDADTSTGGSTVAAGGTVVEVTEDAYLVAEGTADVAGSITAIVKYQYKNK